MTTIPTPPGHVRMMSGQVLPASRTQSMQTQKRRKLLVVLQHYEGDREAAEELALLIADLERTRNHEADILLFRRADSRELSAQAKSKLETKFGKVMSVSCRRTDAKGYPWGPNAMFYDLVTRLAQDAPYRDDYYAFLNLETDATPTRPGWIGELIAAWSAASKEGFYAMGHIQENPVRHLNGLAVYAQDIWTKVGAKALSGGSPSVAYDIWHGTKILPLAKDTPLIVLRYRLATVSPEELFKPNAAGIAPAVYHGVKDGSARDAVRTTFVTKGGGDTVRRPNVYTYFHQTVGSNNPEGQAILDLWRQGWLSAGWNPIVLSHRDAARHPKFAEFEAALAKLPNAVGTREGAAHRFMRWLALDSVGGGLLTDFDVLPELGIDPNTFAMLNDLEGAPAAWSNADGKRIFAARLSKQVSAQWIASVLAYDAQPEDKTAGKSHVNDHTIMSRQIAPESAYELMTHFTASETMGRKSAAMEKFLRRAVT